ncbi:MAG: ATP synthase F0 subunit B [candidate division SR1 bacterium]|nr:ATP synthase F0 subunit B [candidate division SR1 bacterium]
MGEQLSTTTILLNVGIQILNLTVFFLLFKYLLGDKVAKELEEREYLIKKLKNAEFEYNAIIEQAEAKKNIILADALHKQKAILQEGEVVNKKLHQEISDDAKKKANNILKDASAETKRIQDELEKNWEKSVKSTAKLVVNKLLKDKKDLQDEYLKTLIDDVQK